MGEGSEKMVAAARKHRPAALVELLGHFDATVMRLSLALCGEERLGRKSARRVMRQSLEAVHKFRDADDAQRWFLHHTVLESRQHVGRIRRDVLLAADERTDDWFSAFVGAFRHLPIQQREAIILHYGEHLNERYLGIAMDCSMDAAATHLSAAKNQLAALAGDQCEALLVRLAGVYRKLAEASPVVRPEIRRRVARFVWPRRIWRLVFFLVLVGMGWGVWHLRHWVMGILK
jgi:DNA-directed RNA polymerase specialized sigma24 family protein